MRSRAVALASAAVVLAAGSAAAQRAEPLPRALAGVGITEHLGARIPLDLQFTAEDGKPVRLSDYVNGTRPVILTLNYFRCPMLCTLMLNGLVDGLKGLSWTPGNQYEVLTVSFDPLDTPALAMLKKETYMEDLGRPGAAAGWHFLTGTQASIKSLTGAVGFSYRYDPEQQQYAHPTAVFLLTPDGRVSRVLYGVQYPTQTLKLALTEAGEGKLGSTGDQILLYCFHYDANAGRYVVAAGNLMRIGGAATLLVVGVWLAAAWRHKAGKGTPTPPRESGS